MTHWGPHRSFQSTVLGGIKTWGAHELASPPFFLCLWGRDLAGGLGKLMEKQKEQLSVQNGVASNAAVVTDGHGASLASASNNHSTGFIVGLSRKGSYSPSPKCHIYLWKILCCLLILWCCFFFFFWEMKMFAVSRRSGLDSECYFILKKDGFWRESIRVQTCVTSDRYRCVWVHEALLSIQQLACFYHQLLP